MILRLGRRGREFEFRRSHLTIILLSNYFVPPLSSNEDELENWFWMKCTTNTEFGMFLWIWFNLFLLKFERRDVVLIAGLILVMLGISPFLGIAYSAIISIGLFFGIKIFVAKKNQLIQQDVGEGICMECGSRIVDKRCPNCDLS